MNRQYNANFIVYPLLQENLIIRDASYIGIIDSDFLNPHLAPL